MERVGESGVGKGSSFGAHFRGSKKGVGSVGGCRAHAMSMRVANSLGPDGQRAILVTVGDVKTGGYWDREGGQGEGRGAVARRVRESHRQEEERYTIESEVEVLAGYSQVWNPDPKVSCRSKED
jgi:hypothetical protein